MNTVACGAWNIKGGFGDEAHTLVLMEQLKQLDVDVWVLSEAFDATGEFVAADEIVAQGYEPKVIVDRDETDPRSNRMLVMLSRIACTGSKVRLGERNAASLHFSEIGLHVIGAHFDDRSELARLSSSHALANQIDLDNPFILAGDLNAMHGQDRIARLLRQRASQAITEHLPHTRLQNIATRLVGMADGRTMQYLADSGLADADPKHQATLTPYGLPVAQLDHIMYTSNSAQVRQFGLGERATSDHRPIVATIEI